jgi:hypothetical protein
MQSLHITPNSISAISHWGDLYSNLTFSLLEPIEDSNEYVDISYQDLKIRAGKATIIGIQSLNPFVILAEQKNGAIVSIAIDDYTYVNPDSPEHPDAHSFVPLPAIPMLVMFTRTCSYSDPRGFLNSIFLDAKRGKIVSTDGHRIAILSTPDFKVSQDLMIPSFIFSLYKNNLQKLSLSYSGNFISVAHKEFPQERLVCRLDREYTDYALICPESKEHLTKVEVDLKSLTQACNTLLKQPDQDEWARCTLDANFLTFGETKIQIGETLKLVDSPETVTFNLQYLKDILEFYTQSATEASSVLDFFSAGAPTEQDEPVYLYYEYFTSPIHLVQGPLTNLIMPVRV